MTIRRTGPGGRQRVKTAKGRTNASVRWLERQLNDPYVRMAKSEGYRSRAAYKLIELDERFGFLRGAQRVVDLGIAPGGWTQVVRQRLPKAAVVGIDLLPTDPIDGATILEMDFMDETAPDLLKEALGGPDAWVAYVGTAALGAVAFWLYVVTRAWPYLATGVVAVTVAVPEALYDWVEGSLGAAGVLLATGVTLLLSSLAGLRLRHEVSG